MSDAQKLMTDVQRKHRRILNLDDGFSYCQGTRSGQCDFQGGDLNDFEAHVAAEIDKALGGLKSQVCHDIPAYAGARRWVSGWSEKPVYTPSGLDEFHPDTTMNPEVT